MLQISDRGLALIATDESFAQTREGSDMLWPYMDQAGVWTIGAGHVILDENGNRFQGAEAEAAVAAIYPQGLSLADAKALLRSELAPIEACVNEHAMLDTTQGQYDALVSFAYNEGQGALISSTVLRLHNAGKRASTLSDAEARQQIAEEGHAPTNAADALFQWVKAHINGVLVTDRGLVNRRSDERAEYLSN